MSDFVQGVEPGYRPSYDATPQAMGSNMLFRSEVASSIDFRKPAYDKAKKPISVFRFYPCNSFSDQISFVPYRIDPGGHNYFGYWLKRIYVAWNIGKAPSSTFIVHNDDWGIYDPRTNPLAVLVREAKYAIKEGQGKLENWQMMQRRARTFKPDAKMLLEWDGYLEGGEGQSAALSKPQMIGLAQGYAFIIGNEPMWKAGQAMPGWGDNPTCVIGMTAGLVDRAVALLGEEKKDFRGSPGDFENRYVCGDPVGVNTGRFLVAFHKGSDPRLVQAAQPINIDPLSVTSRAAAVAGEKKKEEVGYDCYWSPTHGNAQATLANPSYHAMIRKKWKHWDDVKDSSGRVVMPGILRYPTIIEQAHMLAGIVPVTMLAYAFMDDHPEWLTQSTVERARAIYSGSTIGEAPGQRPVATVNSLPPGMQPPMVLPSSQLPPPPMFDQGPSGPPPGSQPGYPPVVTADAMAHLQPTAAAPVQAPAPATPEPRMPYSVPSGAAPGTVDGAIAQLGKDTEAQFAGIPSVVPPTAPPPPPVMPPVIATVPVAAPPMSAAALAAARNRQPVAV
jgi:hypothetical protein